MNMGSKVDPNEVGMVPTEVDERDAKIFGQVQKIIEDGQLEKLTVDQCKVYLRKNGLRLTGNKITLIQRIKQHRGILLDGADHTSSFVLNCKGDACTGDVVTSEKNVYKMIAEDMNMGSKVEMVLPEVNEGEAKIFDEVQKIIEDGQLEKLKVDHCKAYLRKNGLRLTGNKDTLIQRIKQHQEILRDGAEKKYPASSFVLNCKGDACTGDVVMFEQNVYEMFNIASRSATGPPCGKNIVAGRIVKESYGTAKQQHTFTIEVLWSKGDKPLPPLYSLLIKGRNLYRFRTLRQRWADEGERERVLIEKHSRGFVARSDREARIQEKEIRKQHKATRIPRKESNQNNYQFNTLSIAESAIQMLQPGKPAVSQQQPSGLLADVGNSTSYHQQISQNAVECRRPTNTERVYSDFGKVVHQSQTGPYFPPMYVHQLPKDTCPNKSWNSTYHGQPLREMNVIPPMNPYGRQGNKQPQFCRYYARGKCTYGENCRYVH